MNVYIKTLIENIKLEEQSKYLFLICIWEIHLVLENFATQKRDI